MEIMQAVILILEGDHPIEVKEQVILLHLHITFTNFMNLGDFPSCSGKMLFSSSFPVLFQMPSLVVASNNPERFYKSTGLQGRIFIELIEGTLHACCQRII